MKTRIISTLALMAGVLLSGCTREDMPEGGAPGDGNRVVFTLAGITPQQQNGRTRAAGDSGAAKPDASAATDAEKKVTSLLAAAYEKQPSGGMGFYRAFDVTVTDDGCSFDIAKDGRFDLYLVANADPTLEGAVKALGAGSPVTDLEELLVEQAPDADNAFVMTTPEVLKIISYSGEVADCGEVSLRRLSMRIDLLNKAEGLTITKVTFRNRAVKSRRLTPHALLAAPGAVEDKEYPDLNLVGSFDVPAEYKSKIYGYENLSRRGEATVPTLDIEYTYLDQPYTHTVEFLDRNDPEGLAPLALKRNYLYRITVGRKVEPEFGIEVVDWTNEKSFNVDDITFQAEMNAKLAINHFAGANVKTIDEAQGTVAFTTADPNNTSAYVAWNEKWATAVYYNETDGTYYRVPTKDEMYLLFPDETNHVRFDEAMDGTSEITETLPEKLFGSKETNGGEGKSWFKNAAVVGGSGSPAYPIVYAIRFKGTAQCAAYRYENKNSGDAANGELEIRIKALQANSLLTIGEVADETYWGNPADGDTDAENQLVYHIAATGYKQPGHEDIGSQGSNSFFWTSTEADESKAHSAGHNVNEILMTSYPKVAAGTLRLVKASAEEFAAIDQQRRNAALKVNMFTPFNVSSLNKAQKKVAFFDKLAVAFAECPTDSYFTYTQLKDAGVTVADAVLTDSEGNKYRLPTAGELNLLIPRWTDVAMRDDLGNRHWGFYHPWWNDNLSTNDPSNANADTYVMSDKVSTTGWTETVYLKNGVDNLPDKTTNAGETDGDYIVSGKSWMKKGAQSEMVHYYKAEPDVEEKGNYNIAPVYGLRFQGTSQYAAYRWETCQIGGNPLERYFSIKIKALKKDDTQTTIDDVADEAFWIDGFIEFKFPASGHYDSKVTPDTEIDNISYRGVNGSCWASTLLEVSGGSQAYGMHFYLHNAFLGYKVIGSGFPLRLVRIQK